VRYGGPDSPRALDGVSFVARAGAVVAVVGPPGAGKSTLLRCLAGLLEPEQGAVLYDGVDVARVRRRDLRRHVALALGDAPLARGSVLENIALGAAPDLARARDAARVAEAHDLFAALPGGFDAPVAGLPHGARQRIAIARAAYRRPPVVLLDEAASALDAAAERRVVENLEQRLQGTTIFLATRRLGVVRDADWILVLDGGRLVEQGTHEDLLERRGLYYFLAEGARE
jgi:ATP-binding cassette subfamily B protein